MTWKELKEKAKELGYILIEDAYPGTAEHLETNDVNIIFYNYGSIETNCGATIVKNRTPDQMYQIMLALR